MELFTVSSIIREWNVSKIRAIFANLDKKTGLSGADIPIAIANHAGSLGCYQYIGEEKFWFKPSFINDINTPEAAVSDLIRHEYAHYYVHAARLDHYIGHSKRETSHGRDWKWACKMVGAIPTRCYDPKDFSDSNWTAEDAEAAYQAVDVPEFDILSYVNKWHHAPVLDETLASQMLEQIKLTHPNAYYEVGNEVFHPKRGFGIVRETAPCSFWSQQVIVSFEDHSEGVFNARSLCKMINGAAISFKNVEVSTKMPPSQMSLEDLFPNIFEK